MLVADLRELIRNGESSGVEFKRDDVRPERLAREICSLANLEGGYILLGVEDDGAVSGLTRDPSSAEEWVMSICRNHVQPPLTPFWERIWWDEENETSVGVVAIPANAPDKPYKAKQGSHWVTYSRVGTTSREATREEESRLYQSSGLLRYEVRPVPGAGVADLDARRLGNYFSDIRGQEIPEQGDDEWATLLRNVEFVARDRERSVATVAGLVLFGRQPRRFLPQTGIRATAYAGITKEYDAIEDTLLAGPLVPLLNLETSEIVESGVIDAAMAFVRRHLKTSSTIDDSGMRIDHLEMPIEPLREAIVNAVAHRDYSLSTMDIELSIYSDRIEIISPGRLVNGVSTEAIRVGIRASRNEIIKETLRDYRFIDARGLGVPRKIIAGMREFNGTEPDLIEEENRFVVRLFKGV